MVFIPDEPYPKSPGDSIRASDWNSLVEEVKLLGAALRVVPGTIVQNSKSGTPISGTFAKIAEFTVYRPGTYTVMTFLTNPAVAYGQPPRSGIISRVYVNDIESSQSSTYQLTAAGIRVLRGPDTITVEIGDRIQLYARKALAANSSSGVIGELQISIGNPLAPAVA
jgi:hypothetical protein